MWRKYVRDVTVPKDSIFKGVRHFWAIVQLLWWIAFDLAAERKMRYARSSGLFAIIRDCVEFQPEGVSMLPSLQRLQTIEVLGDLSQPAVLSVCCVLTLRHIFSLVTFASQRFGEARHPGPSNTFSVGVINPTSILNKVDLFHSLGGGIWALSETSATQRVQAICRRQFQKIH